jgi:hypothetical protein
MDELKNTRDAIYGQPAPTGFSASAENLDVSVYQYAAWIMGFVSSHLGGKKIDPSSISLDEELDQKLENCLAKLNELIAYKQKHDEIARRLIRELSGDSPT